PVPGRHERHDRAGRERGGQDRPGRHVGMRCRQRLLQVPPDDLADGRDRSTTAGPTTRGVPLMTYRMTIIHRVAYYSAGEALLRRYPRPTRSGLLRRSAYRSTDDPNKVMLELDLDSTEAARTSLPSADMNMLLDEAGLDVYPPVFIGELIEDLGSTEC